MEIKIGSLVAFHYKTEEIISLGIVIGKMKNRFRINGRDGKFWLIERDEIVLLAETNGNLTPDEALRKHLPEVIARLAMKTLGLERELVRTTTKAFQPTHFN